MREILKPNDLSVEQLNDIKHLENICLKHEKLSMKLNWELLQNRSPINNDDFLCYQDKQLIGFLGLYGFGQHPKEIELTGMVHPEFRQNRVFADLFIESKKECINRKAGRILIITERSSKSGTEFAKSTGAQYSFSEFRMKFNEPSVPYHQSHGIVLRLAEPSDSPELHELDALSFGVSDDELEADTITSDDAYKTQYIAELDGKFIGKIGFIMDGPDGYIFGFVIKPEYRGKGYGRETLSLMVTKLLSENINTILLEVAVENENALSLYKSCGFKEDTVYDYYELKLINI